jgi:formate-dependent nitrite reductase membrane component NrfD
MGLGVAKTKLFQLLITYKDNPLRTVLSCALTTVAVTMRRSLVLSKTALTMEVMPTKI